MKSSFSKIFMLVLAAIAVVMLTACGGNSVSTSKAAEVETKSDSDTKINVVASFYPVAEFTRQVGGDKVSVKTLIPAGVEPHAWEPSAQDLNAIAKSDLFVYNGLVEGWADRAISAIDNKNMHFVKAGKGLFNEKNDPHTWISPRNAIVEVSHIKDGLILADPKNKSYYENNAKAYIEKLKQLDLQFEKLASNAKHKEFVTTHAAFGYLARDYGLKQIPIMGISPLAEPTPKDLKALIKIVKDHKISVIYVEPLVSQDIARTVAKATNTKVLSLNPAAGLTAEQKENNVGYIEIMKDNITNLSKSFE